MSLCERKKERERRTRISLNASGKEFHAQNLCNVCVFAYRLNQMLNHNGGLAIHVLAGTIVQPRRFAKGHLPTAIAQALELLVDNIRGQDDVNDQLAKARHFRRSGGNHGSQLVKLRLHE